MMNFSPLTLNSSIIKKHWYSSLILLLIGSNTFCSATIVDTVFMEDVLKYVDGPSTLVVFDLDNTVFMSPFDFGGDQWFSYMLSEKVSQGLSFDQAVNTVLPLYIAAQQAIYFKLVEPAVETVITRLQQRHIPTIALTSRGVPLYDRTIDQLLHLRIDFSKNPLSDYMFDLSDAYPACYKNGVLFGGSNDKGLMMTKFLRVMGIKPARVIFINDKEKYLHDVAVAMESLGIEYIGIRYGGADEEVKNFNPLLAQAQLNTFKLHYGLGHLFPR